MQESERGEKNEKTKGDNCLSGGFIIYSQIKVLCHWVSATRNVAFLQLLKAYILIKLG